MPNKNSLSSDVRLVRQKLAKVIVAGNSEGPNYNYYHLIQEVEIVRSTQKTEKSGCQQRTVMEEQGYAGMCSTVSGERRSDEHSLREKVLDRNNLNAAYQQVKRNHGGAGIDGMTVDG
ncbi:hypothetical protein PT285_07295 [Lactobacillus sp. ESL0791]|uniref:hypothetical protein n=1 Tax=Lactobacillus sp. ESL0791 TaxID=2983234 RepID=UPI0023F8DB18|nr:hypothetical protein [Lactobacillus sp. ESL0791]MDF7639204.1 hypothetical protein [Lactobacillus sp. ESL0791]